MIFLVTRTYPNPTHNQTTTCFDEEDAMSCFHSYEEAYDEGVACDGYPKKGYGVFLIYCDGYTAQIEAHYGDRDSAHGYPATRLKERRPQYSDLANERELNNGFSDREIARAEGHPEA